MKYLISCGLLWLASVVCLAQPYGDSKFKQKFNKADALVYDGSYMEALPLLEEMYASDTMNANLNHLLGVCYLMGKKDHTLAIRRLEAATRDVAAPGSYEEGNWKEKRAPGITYYYLGKAYHFKNRFDLAVSNYYNYRSYIELDDVETYNQVRQQIQYAENAMELVKNPIAVKITNLGPTINTKYPEYCPIVSADGRILIFNSRREGSTGGALDENGQFYDDIYISNRQGAVWSKPKLIEGSINTSGHDAAIGLSPNGQMLFIYKDDNGDGNIYYSTRSSDGWAAPQLIGGDVNSNSWETHATVNATEDLLVFVSNRLGGYGGRDLWYSKKLPNGEWSLAQNMGSVLNSQYEEEAPFITADGNTLIFSSKGHTSMGGFDIFRSELVDGAWSVPENIGYPINTSEDDVFFTLAPDGRTAYYSSARDGGFGETDIYVLKLPAKKSNAMAVARGVMKVPAMAYADIKAEIVVTDDGGAKVGTYRPNAATGYFVLVLMPGETYTITYKADGYEPVVAKLPVSDDESYQEYEGVLELEEVVFGENIIAIQNETKKLEEEALKAAQKAEEDNRLAQEAEAKAKAEQEQLAIAKKEEEERQKAERLAAQEKQSAEMALAEEQEKAKQADLERRKAEAKARFEAIQAKAAKDAEEEADTKADELAQNQLDEEATARQNAEEESTRLAAQKAEDEAREKVEQEAAELAAKEAAARQNAEEESARLAAQKAEEEAREKAEQEAAELAANEAAARQKAEEESARLAAQKAEEEAKLKAEQEAAELAARQEAARKKAAEQEAKAKAEREAAELAAQQGAAREKAEQAAKERAMKEAALADQQEKVDVAEQQKALELSNKLAEEEAAKLALVEAKRTEIQQRIAELKKQQEAQELAAEKAAEEAEVKEFEIKEMESSDGPVSVGARTIEEKRQAALARIEELKKQKTQVQQQKVVDEKELAEASGKESEATEKKKVLETKVEETKNEIKELQKELQEVESQVKIAEGEVQKARSEVAQAQQKVEADIAEEKRIAEEEKKKAEEAAEAARKVKELEEQAKKKLEEERLAQAKLEKQQREEAERTRQELVQMEALAEQQRQVQAALEAEERKRKEIEAAEADAFSQKEILSNAENLSQLRLLNERLIQDNLDLKRQLAELNAKLDIILSKIDNDEGVKKIDVPESPMLQNLQEGKRLILRNIYFDYNLATLRSKSKYELNKLFEFLKSNPSVRIEVAGHTDSNGNDDYNLRLSRERAQAVVDYLVRNGISQTRLKAVGYGETRPIARNENPDLTDNPIGRQLNRRIEIKLLGGDSKGVETEEVEIPKDSQISK